ncbi:MAG TPA: TonB family protein [Candidatus Acidoferrales bacterium]|jgi:TonB family protein|nr:TonB family protein [Candidatus Acidoferrales bacterium]
MADWKKWEGELAGGEYPLERYLGGSEGSAVFLTSFASVRAAIRLVPAGQAQAGELVERWNRAVRLYHPHLISIFAAGTCAVAGVPLAYLVMEYAEENLAEVLRERPLTADETREMLHPVADVLAYLHGQGLVHGNLKPSNILAVEDTVKVSCEAVAAGEPAADIRALGITLVQALTGKAATVAPGGQYPAVDTLPIPFREMAQNCLHHDPRLQWSAGKIEAWLRSPEQPAATVPASTAVVAKPAAGKPRPRYYVAVVALVVVGVAIVWGLLINRTAAPVPSVAESMPPAPASAPPASAPPASAPPKPSPTGQTAAPKPAPPVRPDREAQPPHGMPAAQNGIVRRVLPDIPTKARNTVHGKVMVVVKVAVNPSGDVSEATLERSGSPYFGRLALVAARHWQFGPGEGEVARHWILRFEIMRTATKVTEVRAGRE